MKKLSFARQVLPALALVAILIAVFIIFMTQPDRSSDDSPLTPPTAPKGNEYGTVAGAGVIEPSSELIEIGAHVPGIVTAVLVEAGQNVSQGQLLFELDSANARSAVNEAAARVERLRRSISAAQTTLNTARRQLDLYRGVSDARAVSQREVIERQGMVDDALARLSVARGELAEAQAGLARARVNLSQHRILAPITGEILQVSTHVGEYVTAGPGPGGSSGPAMTMGQTNPLHVRIDIDENEIDRLDIGKAATISARGNATRRYRARFVRTEPLVQPKRSLTNAASERVDVRVLQLIFAIENEDKGLFVGQQVDAFLPARRSPGAFGKSQPGMSGAKQ